MNQELVKTGSFTAAGSPAAVTIYLGWLPDIVEIVNASVAADGVAEAKWHRGTMGEGLCMTAVNRATNDSGASLTYVWKASGGFTSFNTNVKKPSAWKLSTVYAVGDIVHPTTNNGYYYKCSTAGTSHSAEPTSWGTTIGGTTSEGGGTVVWTCYSQADLPVMVSPSKGFVIPAALQIDSVVCYWKAMRIDDEA